MLNVQNFTRWVRSAPEMSLYWEFPWVSWEWKSLSYFHGNGNGYGEGMKTPHFLISRPHVSCLSDTFYGPLFLQRSFVVDC